jgi:hypothetical protein
MGMYTELHFNSELKKDTPEEVINVLKYMVGDIEEEPEISSHPLFGDTRWRFMLRGDSYYFDADTHSTLRFDDISDDYYLCIRCNFKNYDDEIEKFIDWIMPYLEKYEEGDFLGFYRYEETEEPTLIYYKPTQSSLEATTLPASESEVENMSD